MTNEFPRLAGMAETAEIMGWSKQHLASYIRRGRFPAPVQTLKCGQIWLVETILEYKRERDHKHQEWEAGERQADEDIKAGRMETITNEKELDAYFERLQQPDRNKEKGLHP